MVPAASDRGGVAQRSAMGPGRKMPGWALGGAGAKSKRNLFPAAGCQGVAARSRVLPAGNEYQGTTFTHPSDARSDEPQWNQSLSAKHADSVHGRHADTCSALPWLARAIPCACLRSHVAGKPLRHHLRSFPACLFPACLPSFFPSVRALDIRALLIALKISAPLSRR